MRRENTQRKKGAKRRSLWPKGKRQGAGGAGEAITMKEIEKYSKSSQKSSKGSIAAKANMVKNYNDGK